MAETTYAPLVDALIAAVIARLEPDTELKFRMGYSSVKLPVFNNVPQNNPYPYILVLCASDTDYGDKDSALDRVDLSVSIVTETAGDQVGLRSSARIKSLLRRPMSVRGLVSFDYLSRTSNVGSDGMVRVSTLVYRAYLDAVNS